MGTGRSNLWIIHRDERLRTALRRLAGVTDDALLGAPDDSAFRDAPSPRVVLLGLAGDFEAELEFVHRLSARLPAARWLMLVDPAERPEAERLFDGLTAEWLPFPPTAAELRQKLRVSARHRRQDELSRRRQRDALATRFARYFADLELPEVLRALDPRFGEVPLLVLGEPGTGRALLARYVNLFGGSEGAWLELDCRAIGSPAELHAALAAPPAGEAAGSFGITVCLRDVDALPSAAQFALRSMAELGPPLPLARARRLRWMATAGDHVLGSRAPGLLPELADALAGLSERLPPLRERAPEAVLRFSADTVLAWCRAQGERPRSLAPDAQQAILEYPWPGNQRELEAMLVRSLSAEAVDPLPAERLRFELYRPAITGEGGAELPSRREPSPRDLDEPAPPRAGAARAAYRGGPPSEPRAEPPSEPRAEPGAAAKASEGEAAAPTPDAASTQRIALSLAHELRNGLVSIRTFAALLPEHATDPGFRERFAPAVGSDVRRIEGALERLARFAELPAGAGNERVDMAALLEAELEAHRGDIEARRLLVLKELDRSQPPALGSRAAIAFAFDALLDRVLAWVPERGDLYLASRSISAGLRGKPTLRVVLRFHRPGERRSPDGPESSVPSDRELALEIELAAQALRAQRAILRIDATEAEETLIVVDLPSA